MNLAKLVPPPSSTETFKRSRQRFVPAASGCYVLTTFLGVVLYIGLSNNLQRRMGEHLDNPDKTGETELGRAVLFHWIEGDNTNQIERTWLNIHLQNEGILPVLNRIFSPTSA